MGQVGLRALELETGQWVLAELVGGRWLLQSGIEVEVKIVSIWRLTGARYPGN